MTENKTTSTDKIIITSTPSNYHKVSWDKVKSIEDIIQVFTLIECYVNPDQLNQNRKKIFDDLVEKGIIIQ